MKGSAHERYHDRLAALAGERPGGWARHFARFTPGRSPWATLVHVGPGRQVVTTEVYEAGDAPPGAVPTEAGPALVRPFPDDPALPGLGRVVESAERWQLVRYRPRRRCTLRVETALGPRWGTGTKAPRST